MRSKMVVSLSLAAAGALLAWSLTAADPNPAAANGSSRLISSIEGPALYQAYCAVCHGPTATGNGAFAVALKVSSPDLTRIAARNGGIFPRQRIEKIISGETPLLNGHGARAMPIWGPVFSQVDRDQDLGRVRVDNLTRYLLGLQTH